VTGASGDPGERELVTSRVLDAPRERVFRALSDPEALARWWGPDGFTSTFDAFDFSTASPGRSRGWQEAERWVT
jgi:uncharacterized protein YndB with AHSA1/START domain